MVHPIEEKAQTALSAVIEEIGSPLVATEHFRADTSRIADSFDLSLLKNDSPHDIKVDLRLPSRKELMKLTLLKMVAEGDRPQGKEVQQVISTLNAALEPYYNGDSAKAWQTRVEHGKTTVVFEGVPHDSAHVLNQAYRDIEEDSPLTQGENPNVLKTKNPKASDEQLSTLNKPDNMHGLIAINGHPLLNYQADTIDPRAKFAHSVELVESLERVNATEGLALRPYIKLGRVSGEPTTFAVNNNHQVTAGSIYFGKDALPPEGAVHAALLHENAHPLNGDFTSPALYLSRRIKYLLPVNNIAAVCLQKPDESAEAFLHAAKGNAEAAKTFLGTVDNLLTDIGQGVKHIAAELAALPDLASLSARGLVEDYENGQSQRGFVDEVARKHELPLTTARQFDTVGKHVVAQGKLKSGGELAAEDIQAVKTVMTEVFNKHQALYKDVQLLKKIGSAFEQSTEFLADKRAISHLDDPQKLIDMLEWATEGKGAVLGYSHPSTQERYDAIREWAAEKNAQKPDEIMPEKPVLGAATAAVIKRSTQQGSLQR
ncbi:MAG: hypothetical protein FJX23_08465 [Alphaproteobacteria bacterium]|nr:hypothetical protein [Alphaproteobacteria bacterium]